MGREGTVNIIPAGWDLRKPTQRELLALARTENHGSCDGPGMQDFTCVESPCDRCHGKGCRLTLDKALGDEAGYPGHCLTRDAAWRAWGLP